VIVAARSPEKLKVAKSKGLETIKADLCEAGSIQTLSRKVTQEFPKTNVLIHNAAICKLEDLVQGGSPAAQEEMIATNLLGPMRLNDALLPHLLKQFANIKHDKFKRVLQLCCTSLQHCLECNY
jgi:uncharacterized oxidoreductase